MTYRMLAPLDFQKAAASEHVICVDLRPTPSESIRGARALVLGSLEWEQLVTQPDKAPTLMIFEEGEQGAKIAATRAQEEGFERVGVLAGGLVAWRAQGLPLEHMNTTAWDARYASDEMLYGHAPVPFFAEQLRAHQPGRLLLPADGEGRNGVWAATQGWQVDAFDISARAREKALSFAGAQGVHIDYRLASFDDAGLPADTYDLAALCYAHVPPHVRRAGLEHIKRAVKPGGSVILEAFCPAHLDLGHPYGPKSAEYMYSVEELRVVFEDWDIEALDEHHVELDAGRHDGPGIVVQMVARKPLMMPSM